MKYYHCVTGNYDVDYEIEDYIAFPDSWTEQMIWKYLIFWLNDMAEANVHYATDYLEKKEDLDQALQAYYDGIYFDCDVTTKEDFEEHYGWYAEG